MKLTKKMLGGIGEILKIPGFCALISLFVSWGFGEYVGVKAFAITAAVCLIPAYILSKTFRNRNYNIIEMMLLAFLGWLVTSLAGSLPFLLMHPVSSGVNNALTGNFINAFFESTSGFTSTGLTMVESESALNPALQWWRSLMQWVGGIGIIIFLSAFFDAEVNQADEKYSESTTTMEKPSAGPDLRNSWWIYLLLTVLAIGFLLFQDIPVWEAINHGMTTASTGGFTITDNSIAHYNNTTIYGISLIIILSSMSFTLYHRAWKKKSPKPLLIHQQTLMFFIILLAGLVLINILDIPEEVSFTDKFFQVLTTVTTAGFTTAEPSAWGAVMIIIFASFMMTGGTTNSTTGGVKVGRILVIIKGIIPGLLRQGLHSGKEDIRRLKINPLQNPKFRKIFINTVSFCLIWLNIYWLLVLILLVQLPAGTPLTDVIFESASVLGNAGPSSGITDVNMPDSSKFVMIIFMLVGRLELIPVMLLMIGLVPKRS